MAPKSAYIFFAILSVAAVALPAAAAAGWQPIENPNAPEVVAIAKFAVAAYNKDKKMPLVLVSVLNGESQVVAGINYRLLITAKDDGAAVPFKTYTTVVYSSPSGSLSLVSFQAIED